jgi:hypothetical protein
VGNVFECPEVIGGAGDEEQVVDAGAVALGLRVVGIEGFDAIDHVPEAEELRGERANGCGPDTGVVFGHFDIARAGPTAVECDLGGLGCRKAEGDSRVRMDIWRSEFDEGSGAGLGEREGAEEQGGGEDFCAAKNFLGDAIHDCLRGTDLRVRRCCGSMGGFVGAVLRFLNSEAIIQREEGVCVGRENEANECASQGARNGARQTLEWKGWWSESGLNSTPSDADLFPGSPDRRCRNRKLMRL